MKKVISLVLSVLILLNMGLCSVQAVTPDATAEISKVAALPGDKVEVFINLTCDDGIKTLSFFDFSFDNAILTLVESECAWLAEGKIADIDFSNNVSIITFEDNITFNGDILKLVFEVSENATVGILPVSCDVIGTKMIEKVETEIDVSLSAGEVEVLDSTAQLSDFEYEISTDGIIITAYTGTKTTVVIGESYEVDGVLYDVVEIAESAFESNKEIEAVTIPATVKSIGGYAFYECTSLTEVTILSKNTEIGEVALGYYFISRKEDGVVDGFTINGYASSTAEVYANSDERILFVVLEETGTSVSVINETTTITESGLIYGVAECIGDLSEYIEVVNGTIEYEYSNDYQQLGTGTVVNVFDSEGNHFASYTIVIFGDYNGDGVADSEDTAYFASISNFEIFNYFDYEHLFIAADVNSDGVVDAMDEEDMYAVANYEAYIDQTITEGSKVVRY